MRLGHVCPAMIRSQHFIDSSVLYGDDASLTDCLPVDSRPPRREVQSQLVFPRILLRHQNLYRACMAHALSGLLAFSKHAMPPAALADAPHHNTPMLSPPSKPRLLYRGPLRLPDGTLLSGVAFVSTVSPFGAVPSSNDDFDADICLTLEMVRNGGPLNIRPLDESSIHSQRPLISTLPASSRTKQIRSSQVAEGHQQQLEASGHIRM